MEELTRPGSWASGPCAGESEEPGLRALKDLPQASGGWGAGGTSESLGGLVASLGAFHSTVLGSPHLSSLCLCSVPEPYTERPPFFRDNQPLPSITFSEGPFLASPPKADPQVSPCFIVMTALVLSCFCNKHPSQANTTRVSLGPVFPGLTMLSGIC